MKGTRWTHHFEAVLGCRDGVLAGSPGVPPRTRAAVGRGAQVVAASMSKPLSSADWRGRRKRGPRLTVAAQASIRHRPWLPVGVPLNEFGAGLSQYRGVRYFHTACATRLREVRPWPFPRLLSLRTARPQKTTAFHAASRVFRRGAGAVRRRVPFAAPGPDPQLPRATPRPSAASPPSPAPACGRRPPGRSSSAPARRA